MRHVQCLLATESLRVLKRQTSDYQQLMMRKYTGGQSGCWQSCKLQRRLFRRLHVDSRVSDCVQSARCPSARVELECRTRISTNTSLSNERWPAERKPAERKPAINSESLLVMLVLRSNVENATLAKSGVQYTGVQNLWQANLLEATLKSCVE